MSWAFTIACGVGAFLGGFLPGLKLRWPTKEERQRLKARPTLKIDVSEDGVMSWELLNPRPGIGISRVDVMHAGKPIGFVSAGEKVRLPR